MRSEVDERPDSQLTPWCYVACYGLYALILVGCFFAFWMWRRTAELVVAHLYRKADAQDAVYLTSTLVIGLVLFVLAVGGEPYLREGLEHPHPLDRRRAPLRRLVERFARLVLPLVGSLFVALLLQEWALTGIVASATSPPSRGANPPPAVAARATLPASAGTAPGPSTQDRGAPVPGPWIYGAALALAGSIVFAAVKRPR